MKKNLVMRIAAVVLMCTLVTACFASSTFAKYTSSGTATSVARVAKWDIDVGTDGHLTAANPVIKFDLFDTAKLLDSDGTKETDVVASGTDVVIAPGTKGAFTLDTITNNSEVTAEVTVIIKSINKSDSTIPVVLKQGEKTLKAGDAIVNQAKINPNGGKLENVTPVDWEWVFSTGSAADQIDTTLGVAGNATITVELEIIATQVD